MLIYKVEELREKKIKLFEDFIRITEKKKKFYVLWLELVNTDHVASHSGTEIRADKERKEKGRREQKKERERLGPETCVCFRLSFIMSLHFSTVCPGGAEDVCHRHGDKRQANKEK